MEVKCSGGDLEAATWVRCFQQLVGVIEAVFFRGDAHGAQWMALTKMRTIIDCMTALR